MNNPQPTPPAKPPPYKFSSAEGAAICKTLIHEQLGYYPHTYQLEGVQKALDKTDVLAITPTGSGKTGFLTMYLLVMHAVMNNPERYPNPPKHFRKDGAMVVVCPTRSLEVDMEPKFHAAGLSVLVINALTADAARRKEKDIWEDAPKTHVLILAPEQLTSKGFENLAKNTVYRERVAAIGVDEAHLLNSWGLSFRKAFNEIGGTRMRFQPTPILIALTATLRAGAPLQSVETFLGLDPERYHLIRRSNVRNDIRVLFRTVQSSAHAMMFPELDWVLTEQRRVIVFCRTIALGFRVAVYLHARAQVDGDNVGEQVRLYNSLNWESYNIFTLDLMRSDNRSSWVTVATDTLSVGIDIATTDDVVLYDFQLPPDTDSILQKAGRIRDGTGKNSRVVVYLPKSAVKTCEDVLARVADGAPATVVKIGAGKRASMVDVGVARLVTAVCKSKMINRLYANPTNDPLCDCDRCLQQRSRLPTPASTPSCNWSCCEPESSDGDVMMSTVSDPSSGSEMELEDEAVSQAGPHSSSRHRRMVPPPSKTKKAAVPRSLRITLKMRDYAYRQFGIFCKSIRDGMGDCDLLPPEEILPDNIIDSLLDNFYDITDIRSLRCTAKEYEHLDGHYDTLLVLIQNISARFEEMRKQTKAEAAAKARDTRARKKAETEEAANAEGGAASESSSELESASDVSEVEDPDEEEEFVPMPIRVTIKIPGGRFQPGARDNQASLE
ncbi:P-loop containing nucleoside triphosphate hydrolase protein [Daedaleopsis nitida]|nr:P-loop containing nucleoside triphosphate hydrolase protein [Daedaleopsis nitida]